MQQLVCRACSVACKEGRQASQHARTELSPASWGSWGETDPQTWPCDSFCRAGQPSMSRPFWSVARGTKRRGEALSWGSTFEGKNGRAGELRASGRAAPGQSSTTCSRRQWDRIESRVHGGAFQNGTSSNQSGPLRSRRSWMLAALPQAVPSAMDIEIRHRARQRRPQSRPPPRPSSRPSRTGRCPQRRRQTRHELPSGRSLRPSLDWRCLTHA